jgi:hypothetical protein
MGGTGHTGQVRARLINNISPYILKSTRVVPHHLTKSVSWVEIKCDKQTRTKKWKTKIKN